MYCIRKTNIQDLNEVLDIYKVAREFMIKNRNDSQWGHTHPPKELIINDIKQNKSHVCIKDKKIACVFYFNIEEDSTYTKIDGKWLNDLPYGVIHRIARASDAKGAGTFCINWCYSQCKNIRIDTHRDNKPMLTILNKLGFIYCGIIWLENKNERLAFQK